MAETFSPAKQKLETLQVGRGFAALAVVISHAAIATHDFIGGVPSGVTYVISQGYLGVDFFFVLSGFIILQVHQGDARTAQAARTYLRKRALRIYVPYLPIGIGLALVYLLAPHLSAAPRDWGLLTSVTLFPTEQPPALSVAWTLVHEVTFYAIFLLFYVTRRFAWLLVTWGGALSYCLIVGPKFHGFFGAGLVKTVLDPINLEFLFGMLACLAWSRLSQPIATVTIALGSAACVAYISLNLGVGNRVLFGAAVAFVVAPMVTFESKGILHGWPLLVVLGDASYALYLIHDPVISVAIRLARALHLEWWSALTCCVAISLAAGLAYNLLFENPTRQLLSKRFAPAQLRG